MRIRMLKSIGGYGQFVQGAPRLFSLCEGDVAEVEDAQARKWVGSGIAVADPEIQMKVQATQKPAQECAVVSPAHNAMRTTPQPRSRRGNR